MPLLRVSWLMDGSSAFTPPGQEKTGAALLVGQEKTPGGRRLIIVFKLLLTPTALMGTMVQVPVKEWRTLQQAPVPA